MNKKHELFEELCEVLGIETSADDFSDGSTLTKSAVIKCFNAIFSSLEEQKTKQQIFKDLCSILGNDKGEQYFSSGSTITAEGWEYVLNKLKSDL